MNDEFNKDKREFLTPLDRSFLFVGLTYSAIWIAFAVTAYHVVPDWKESMRENERGIEQEQPAQHPCSRTNIPNAEKNKSRLTFAPSKNAPR